MTQSVRITLTENALTGLLFIYRYRFLTIAQYARAVGLHHETAASQLRHFERHGILGFFGNTRLAGNGKTPKAYYLTRKGWELVCDESGLPPELLGSYKEIKVEAAWAPQMYHRLRTIDLLIALEVAVRNRPHLAIIQTFLEYRRMKRGSQIQSETTDYVDAVESGENKIIPDAAFILENTNTKRRGLFFVEMDMATERIISSSAYMTQTTLHRKFSQYDRYLKSFRYAKTYQEFGEFRSFTMLFVTIQEARIENLRRELSDLSEDLGRYYRLTTFEEAMGDFLGAIWHSRLLLDTNRYPLVRE
jgi:protein involved in plasmid replication-relaxation